MNRGLEHLAAHHASALRWLHIRTGPHMNLRALTTTRDAPRIRRLESLPADLATALHSLPSSNACAVIPLGCLLRSDGARLAPQFPPPNPMHDGAAIHARFRSQNTDGWSAIPITGFASRKPAFVMRVRHEPGDRRAVTTLELAGLHCRSPSTMYQSIRLGANRNK